jgi:hypothetical protein
MEIFVKGDIEKSVILYKIGTLSNNKLASVLLKLSNLFGI